MPSEVGRAAKRRGPGASPRDATVGKVSIGRRTLAAAGSTGQTGTGRWTSSTSPRAGSTEAATKTQREAGSGTPVAASASPTAKTSPAAGSIDSCQPFVARRAWRRRSGVVG